MPNTSELRSEALIASLRHQPLLVVLRADQPLHLRPRIERLQRIGVGHIELAWSTHPEWSSQCRTLVEDFPLLRFGAASVCDVEALQGVARAGLGFAVSPVLDPALLAVAAQLDLTLVPGVMTPTEVHQARAMGCGMVKLFPAAALGRHYWRRLAAPLGTLPFCIAAGGLSPADLCEWLAAGVDAVAIGGSLGDDAVAAKAWLQLEHWLASQSG